LPPVRLRAVALGLAVLLGPPAAARAGDPIMPLSEVEPGMRCTGYTVVRGTEPSSFDVEVIDILDQRPHRPRIVVRVSGPAVDATGIGLGFSGSPVYCPDEQGTQRNAGAIAAGLGDFGNRLGLATSIEEILGEPVEAPPAARPMSERERRSVRSLAGPLTVAGLSAPLERALAAAGRRAGRPVITAPGSSTAQAAVQPLRPGSSVAVGFSSGDVAFASVGTVAYVDGDAAWLFGHPLDAAGRRSLLLQHAPVLTVVPSPDPEAPSYKLAVPGASLGTVTNDALGAVVGRAGALPRATALSVSVREQGSGRVEHTSVSVPDEVAVGVPSGFSPLSLVAPLAAADASVRILRSVPARQSGSMCARVTVAPAPRPLRFCNRYVTRLGGGIGAALADDLARAIELLDVAAVGPLAVERAHVSLRVQRGAAQAFMVGATLPRRLRAGGRHRASVAARMPDGSIRRFRFRLRVPSDAPTGPQDLILVGADPDEGGVVGEEVEAAVTGEAPVDEGEEGPRPARSLPELAAQFGAIRRYDGVLALFGDEEELGVRAFRDPEVRIGGRLVVPVRVTAR
jgi:hypothetical protein